MKSKFFFLLILFMGFGAYTFAQSAADAAPAKQDAPKQEMALEKSADSKSNCKWVDADNDGICDTCGCTKKECETKCNTASKKGCDPAACSSKSKAKSSCCSSKGAKKK